MNRNVLVVDDEPSIRMLLERALGKAGCTVLTASDGQEAEGDEEA